MNSLIVTHPGKAHFDEFLAISLILAVHPDTTFGIQRRHPTAAELAAPDVWVVDVGGRYEPERQNFDHHQDLDLNASFVLVARHLNLEDRFEAVPWWRYKDRIDRYGPFKIAAELGVSSLLMTFSPLESWLLELFKRDPSELCPLIRSFGRKMIDDADRLIAQFSFWEQSDKITIKGRIVLIGHTRDATGSQRYSSRLSTPAAISVSYDNRGQGWRLARLNDAAGVDFSRLEGHPAILFAHKSGFLAKTKERLPLEKVLDLVELAID